MKNRNYKSLAYDRAVMGYKSILKGLSDLGYDIENENFKDTAARCARAIVNDFVLSRQEINEQFQSLDVTFPSKHDEMIVQTAIPVISLCPHHLLPIEMSVTIGYIPNKEVLGLSKLARLAKLIGKQPILQEDYTEEIASRLEGMLGPRGIGVYVVGIHGCMRFRGVGVAAPTVTSKLTGNFKKQPATREEFLQIARKSDKGFA